MTTGGPIAAQQLSRSDRPALAAHFVELAPEDRRLRFGVPKTDESIRQYVEQLDFERDAVFGVWDDQLALLGVAHVALSPDAAEFGVSVVPDARGRGIGTALFERANVFARTHMIRTMFMHCLLENGTMMRIARKSGMKIVAESGEADAYLELPPAGLATITKELMDNRVALLDVALKRQMISAKRLARAFGGTDESDPA